MTVIRIKMLVALALGLVLLTTNTFGQQTYFSDDFSANNNGNFANWVVLDNDAYTGFMEPWWAFDHAYSGIIDYDANGFPYNIDSDNLLVTSSPIDLTTATGTIFLNFEISTSTDDYSEDHYSVYLTTGNTLNDILNSTAVYSETFSNAQDVFVPRNVDVSAYAGTTVYLCFRHHSSPNSVQGLSIDNIEVTEGFDDDANLFGIALTDPFLGGNKTIDVTVSNVGLNPINSFTLDWDLDGGAISSESFAGLNIAPGGSEVVSVDLGVVGLGVHTWNGAITGLNGGADDNSANDLLSEDFEIVHVIPDWTLTDSYGNSHSMHDVLSQGDIVVLDFFASWCGPCQTSTPDLEQFYQNNGAGNNGLKVFGMSIEPNDDSNVVNSLGWGATFPKFPYSAETEWQFLHYSETLALNQIQGVPFFVIICPNTNDPGNSTVIGSNLGYNPTLFSQTFQTAATNCNSSVNVEENASALLAVNCFPNPATDRLEVSWTMNENDVQITLVNTVGELVLKESFIGNGSTNTILNTEHLSAGIYFLNVTSGKLTETIKIMIAAR